MKKINAICLLTLSGLPAISFAAEAEASVTVSLGYILWISLCCFLVFFMQVGFLMIESGMVRSKNTINVIMKNFTDVGFGVLGFWIVGYGLMYGLNSTGWIGTTQFLPEFDKVSESLNLLYQMMFAITAATIVSGAVAERFKFLHYLVGAMLITTFIYPIFGSWAWGGTAENPGWLRGLGFYDFAGSTVVHSIGAWSALGALLILGPRHGRYSRKGALHDIPGHNLPFVSIGAFFLWFGWFGFNGGSVSSDFSNLGKVLLNTQMGAVGGICGAIFWMVITKAPIRMTNTINGALAGLVSVTAGANVFSLSIALLTSVIGGMILVMSTNLLHRWKIDDAVGAIPVHGFAGVWGTFAVGLFFQGDMFNIERMIAQTVGIVTAFIWAMPISLMLYWALNKFTSGIRVNTHFEQRGLDLSEHSEIGYSDFMDIQINAQIRD